MPSASKLFTYLFYTWRQYDANVTFVVTLMSWDSVCCMWGEASSSRWLMTQLSNGQHSWVLVFVPMLDILNIPCNCQFVFSVSYLTNFMFHATLDAVGNILRVHYKSMKCDVSFSQGSVSTLFRWGEHVFNVCVCVCVCENVLPVYSSAKTIKRIRVSPARVMIANVLPRFFVKYSVYDGKTAVTLSVRRLNHLRAAVSTSAVPCATESVSEVSWAELNLDSACGVFSQLGTRW